jgi:hypothetical protein
MILQLQRSAMGKQHFAGGKKNATKYYTGIMFGERVPMKKFGSKRDEVARG